MEFILYTITFAVKEDSKGKEKSWSDVYAKWDAIIRYHYRMNPEELNDQEYWELVAEYRYAKEIEQNGIKNGLREVASEILKAIYGK